MPQRLSPEERLVTSFTNTLAIAWRVLYLKHGGEPPAEVWRSRKQEILAEESGFMSWSNLHKIDAKAAFDEACRKLEL